MDRSIDLLDEIDRQSGHAFELNRRGYVFLTADPMEAGRLRAEAGDVADFLAGHEDIHARYPFVTDRVVRHASRPAGGVHERVQARTLAAGTHPRARRRTNPRRSERARHLSGASDRSPPCVRSANRRAHVRARGWSAPSPLDRSARAQRAVVNELHGKISFDDEAAVIPREAPLMIWNDAVDLGERGRFPAGVHFRPRGDRSILGLWTYDTRIEEPQFPPVFDRDYADIVIRGLAVMVPGLSVYIGRSPTVVVDGGYYCKVPDNRPLVGPTAIEGAYVLGALSGFGIMASQAAAELLAADARATAARLRSRVPPGALRQPRVPAHPRHTGSQERSAQTLDLFPPAPFLVVHDAPV